MPHQQSQPNQDSQTEAVTKLFDETRRKLVETGTRNRLIHVNRQNKRSNSLEIINAGSEDIFELIYASRKTMRFLAMGNDKAGDDETSPVTAHGQTQDTSERYNKNKLEKGLLLKDTYETRIRCYPLWTQRRTGL